ncbi:MAG TPA: 2OG-Fe(II) oxygenase family protein [Bryobacteraceae bacterium]|jgi:isopenicillin N synthase-like dioxygenase
MIFPELDLREISPYFPAHLGDVARRIGCFRIRHPLFSRPRCEDVIGRAREFFALPAEQKQRLAIEQSPHFRGYSVMESRRDWREQIHFGTEEAARCTPPFYEQLRGPNLWPVDCSWRTFALGLMDDFETVGRDVLAALALALELPPTRFLPGAEVPYRLLKLIHYRGSTGSPRSGVAPHVDFSWITLLLEDQTGGLEVRIPDGSWIPVPPIPGTLLVNIGEILEFASGGVYRATPHRVVTGARSRVSLPFFLNPALDARIEPVRLASSPPDREPDPLHVHRVFSQPRETPFAFGDEEWQRKGLGKYCESCCAEAPVTAANAAYR